MSYTYMIKLPLKFSNIIIHDGVPEFGVIEDYTRQWVEWSFTGREIHAILSDARRVQQVKKPLLCGKVKHFYSPQVRESAHNAEIRLENLINAKNIPKPLH